MSLDTYRINKINGLAVSKPEDTLAFAERVSADGAIVENLPAVEEVLNKVTTESLVMIPSAGKADVLFNQTPSDGDFTVSGLLGTRTNELGLIVPRIDDAPRIDYSDNDFIEEEPESINLATNSENLTLWGANRSTVTADTDIAPDGTLTADTIEMTSASNANGFNVNKTITVAAGDVTWSAYVKKGSTDWLALNIGKDGNFRRQWFDLNTGVLGASNTSGTGQTLIDSNITVIDSEWFRIDLSITVTAGVLTCVLYPSTDTNNSFDGVFGDVGYAWGLQLTQSTQLTRYVRTEGVIAGVPPTYSRTGVGALLLEPQSENLTSYSQELDNAFYLKANGSMLANIAISPDGTLNADAYIEDTSTNTHDFYKFNYIAVTAVPYTYSIFVKKKGNRNVRLTSQSGANFLANFDLTLGVVTLEQSATATIEDVGNGWFRCSITGTPTAGNMGLLINSLDGTSTNYLGDGTSGLYLWGAQIEELDYLTSYVPTTTVAVTRTQDVITNGGNYETLDTDEGVLFFEAKDGNPLHSTERDISLSDGSLVNNVIIRYGGDPNQVEVIISRNPGLEVFFDVTISDTTVYNKFAIKWKQNDFALWINGVELATNTTSNAPITLDRLNFDNGVGGDLFIGSVRQIRVFPSILTDAQLKKLTT